MSVSSSAKISSYFSINTSSSFDKIPMGLQGVALDVLRTLVRNSSCPLPEPLITLAFPAAINCIHHTDDNTALQTAVKIGGVDRLTDTSKYTGSHKERFDESGKGKGISGRKDIADTSGYVGGYKGAGIKVASTANKWPKTIKEGPLVEINEHLQMAHGNHALSEDNLERAH